MILRKRILLVSSGFYPEISPRSFRATELAKEFCRQGNEVTIISKFREHDYSDFLEKYPMTLKMLNKPILPRVPIIKQKPFYLLSSIVSRLLTLLFEYPGIEEMFQVRNKLKKELQYDLMISFAVPYPVHWGVAWARSEKHRISRVWIADCGDPYMGDVLDSFRKPLYFALIEKWFCRKADYLTVPIETAKAGYYKEFHDKIRVIPQGFDFDRNEIVVDQNKNDIPTFAYAGGFLPGARDPRPLMSYLASLPTPFRFLVFTNNPDLLYEYKSKLGEKLIISSYIPRTELLKILGKMDFLINFDNNTPLNSPSKLIDYAIANRPVLNIDRSLNTEAVLSFLNRDFRNRMHLPNVEKFHIKYISQQFLAL